MWAVAASVYVVAVFHRSSLGVAGIDAQERFDVSASQLSLFPMLQLLVYAGLQIPVGALTDRFGAKRVLTCGLVLMTAGQFTFAFAHGFTGAVFARVLVGMGDAMTFVSVLRVVSVWFPSQRAAVLTQLTALLGMAGNLASATPLAGALHAFGWSRTFAVSAGMGVLVLLVVLAVLRDHPDGVVRARPVGGPGMWSQVRAAWAEPGTRLGLWAHWACGCLPQVFLMLWGFPFLVEGQGLSKGTASTLLTVAIVINMVACLVVGPLITRRPRSKLPLCVGMPVLAGLLWAAVLIPSEPSPLWLLVLLALVIGPGGALSLVGMEFARAGNPPHRLGTVSGIVNVGGFAAATLCLFAIGLVLDLVEPGDGAHSLDAYRVAMAVQAVPLLLGVGLVVHYARRVRAKGRSRDAVCVVARRLPERESVPDAG
ncbi:MFS transporter [Embleya sp. NBC_00896]|uniref:MFS transporter n=1 Tax=Embleya sp. NBC_00896 TaxID=2975961 RepID=UPI003870167B|nr:MFS transporter [Embleya sp. NBC_00896]